LIQRYIARALLLVALPCALTAQQATPRRGGSLVIAGSSDLRQMNSLVASDNYTTQFIENALNSSRLSPTSNRRMTLVLFIAVSSMRTIWSICSPWSARAW